MDVLEIKSEKEVRVRSGWLQLSDVDIFPSSIGEVEGKALGLVRAELFFLDQKLKVVNLTLDQSEMDGKHSICAIPSRLDGYAHTSSNRPVQKLETCLELAEIKNNFPASISALLKSLALPTGLDALGSEFSADGSGLGSPGCLDKFRTRLSSLTMRPESSAVSRVLPPPLMVRFRPRLGSS